MKRALCPGSMGELVQGVWEGKEVLISLTIDRFAEMEVNLVNALPVPKTQDMQKLWKSKRALEIALEEWGLVELGDHIEFRRRRCIPEGKGYASSTADIAALLTALARLMERDLREEDIARIALQVEPSDSIVFSQMCLFDHLWGSVLIRFPVPKNLGVVVVELPGTIDTVSVNRGFMYLKWSQYKTELGEAFENAQRGLEEGNLRLLGKAATLSSRIAQSFFPEPIFEKLVEMNSVVGGLGVNRAHTGKAFGILFDTRICRPEEMLRRVRGCLAGEKVILWAARVISGGARLVHL